MRELPRNVPRFRPVEMILDDPDVEFLLDDILPERGVAAIYGPSKAGKTFVALEIMAHLACASPACFGIPLKPARVAYLALEGKGGMKQRLHAWQLHNGLTIGPAFQMFTDPFRLDNPREVDDLATEIAATLGTGCVVVIDTLAQAMAGYDENNSAEMGAAIAGSQSLSDKLEGLVVLIHHTGKDPTKGLRGHSSLLAALDAAIEVKAKGNLRSWRVEKAKDGEEGQQFDFTLERYAVGLKRDGTQRMSCAVRQTVHAPSAHLPPVSGVHRVAVMAKLTGLLPPGSVMPITAAIVSVAPELSVSQKRQGSVAKSTIEGLIVSGHLIRAGDTILLPP